MNISYYVEEIFGTGNKGKSLGIAAAKGVCTCDEIGKCTCETKVYNNHIKTQKIKIVSNTSMSSMILLPNRELSKIQMYECIMYFN